MTEMIDVTVTYLEQINKPSIMQAALPPVKVALLRAEHPPVHYYRYLYTLVGTPYNWVSRTLIDDKTLTSIITHQRVFIYVLYVQGVPAGFAEIDARHPRAPEIKFFGLSPEYIGKGYGRYFFSQIVDLAWTCMSAPGHDDNTPDNAPANGPEKVLIETCTLDHPAALPLYQKFGFTVYAQRAGRVPRLTFPSAPRPHQKTDEQFLQKTTPSPLS